MSRITYQSQASHITFYILFLALLLAGLGWTLGSVPTQAQDNKGTATPKAMEDLDTILARAAAKSFLVTLTRPELSGVMNFYLTDKVKASNILAGLQNPPATGFVITASGWSNDKTYQVQAIVEPESRQVTVYTGKYDGRWQVEGIDLLLASATSGQPISTNVVTTTHKNVQPVSGNGSGKLVFQTQSGGGIYLINADGTGLRYITNGIDPQLSPDGKRITFTRWEPEYTLFTINVDGAGEQSWARGWREMKSPTWTADGSSLLFSWQSGGRLTEEKIRIDLAEAAKNGDNPKIPAEARDVEVKDGILRYRIPSDAHWGLKQVKLADGRLQDLPAGQYAYSPAGNPTKLNEVIYTFGGSGIARFDVNSNNVYPVTSDPRDRAPIISPDGAKVVVSYWQDGNWEIYTMNIDGSNRQRLTSTPITAIAEQTELNTEFIAGKERIVAGPNVKWNNAAPVWSPDGKQIAFLTDRSDKWEIWIMNVDGSNQRPMFSNGVLNDLTFNYAGMDERMVSWR